MLKLVQLFTFSAEFVDVWVQVPGGVKGARLYRPAGLSYILPHFLNLMWTNGRKAKTFPFFCNFIVTPVYTWPGIQTRVLLGGGGVVLMSVRELIVSRVNIDINTIRRRSSRRARQHKGVQSAEVNLWKRRMWVEKKKVLSSDPTLFSHPSAKHDSSAALRLNFRPLVAWSAFLDLYSERKKKNIRLFCHNEYRQTFLSLKDFLLGGDV